MAPDLEPRATDAKDTADLHNLRTTRFLAHRFPLRFGLRTLLIAAPLSALLVAWSTRRPTEAVHAWIVIDQRDLANENQTVQHFADEEAMHAPYASHMKRLLAHVLQQPDIANLSLVRRQADPFSWLQTELVVDVQREHGLVRLSLEGREAAQLRRVIDCVAAAIARDASGSFLR